MAKGSIGVGCGTIIYRRQKPVNCNCSKCSNYRIVDDIAYCMSTGDVVIKPVKTCLYYNGPYIYIKKNSKYNKKKKPNNYKKKKINKSKKN